MLVWMGQVDAITKYILALSLKHFGFVVSSDIMTPFHTKPHVLRFFLNDISLSTLLNIII